MLVEVYIVVDPLLYCHKVLGRRCAHLSFFYSFRCHVETLSQWWESIVAFAAFLRVFNLSCYTRRLRKRSTCLCWEWNACYCYCRSSLHAISWARHTHGRFQNLNCCQLVWTSQQLISILFLLSLTLVQCVCAFVCVRACVYIPCTCVYVYDGSLLAEMIVQNNLNTSI